MINIFSISFMVMAFQTILQRVKKAAFMPVLAHLSCCGQQRISVDVVGKVAKPYLCPPVIFLLLPFGERAVSAAFALQPFTKSPLLQQLYTLLRPISGIGVYISARVAFLQQPIKHLTVVY